MQNNSIAGPEPGGVLGGPGTDHRAELCALLTAESDRVIGVWERLGDNSPTLGSPSAGTQAVARERYLRPLLRTLIGAVGGSNHHHAIYLDERVRYLEEIEVDQRAARLRRALAVELPLLLSLIADEQSRTQLDAALRRLHAPLIEPVAPAGKILFIGDCLFVETRAFLAPLARAAGRPLEFRQVFFSANQDISSVNTAVVDEVRAYAPELIGISLFTFEGVPPYAAAWRQAGRPLPRQDLGRTVQGLTELVRQLLKDVRAVTDATVVLHAPGGLPLDPVRRRLGFLPSHSYGQRKFLAALGSSLSELADAVPNVLLLDERELTGKSADLRRLNGPVFDPTDVPTGYAHTTRFGPELARRYDEIASSYHLLGRAKALLVDFDNTLWSGVMAEGPVVHHQNAQKLLLELKQSGVLLVALSKNDPGSIRWDEMALKPEDFVLQKVNWAPKPDNAAQAIAELNLGANAFVLLDDNPVERALVIEQVPGVQALDPTDPATWTVLRRWLAFPSTTQTEEARRRTEMYREAAERRAAMTDGLDYPTMMKSLKLRCVVRPAGAADRDRLLELIQRTNQFNTTTRRRSATEVEQLSGDPDFGVFVLELRDRFGDLGVVAVAIFDRRSSTFDAVIMSCRAMGFGVEAALVRVVLDIEGPPTALGLFVPTERNSPAAGLFTAAGFVEVEPGLFRLPDGAQATEIPSWLAVKVAV